MDLAEKEAIEIEFWRTSPKDSPEADSLENLVIKFSDIGIFSRKLAEYAGLFASAQSIVELGAGQGWASAVVKRQYPDKHLTITDIGPEALMGVAKWEHIFKLKIDAAQACRSYELPFADASVDLLFSFAAAHHFVRHRRTLKEIERVLKPGGSCVYLYEPACPRYIHPLAFWRVNRKRPDVPEDVLIIPELKALAAEAGLKGEVRFDRSYASRGLVEQNYYFLLQKLPFLSYLLPCTADFIFTKENKCT